MNIDIKKIVYETLGVDVTDSQTKLFEIYLRLLQEWNTKINLTAITETNDIVIKHFVDSLSVLKLGFIYQTLNCTGTKSIDIGTGAGFPGVPLKVMCPSHDLTLLDSVYKKTVFLTELVTQLGLTGVNIVNSRAETVGQENKHRQKYTLCYARAVAKLEILAELCLPLVKPGGYAVLYKTPDPGVDMVKINKMLKPMSAVLEGVHDVSYKFNNETYNRQVYVIKQTGTMNSKYPRNPGLIQKKPLTY